MSKCCQLNRYISSQNATNCSNGCCTDICTNPQCGDPRFLSILAPVVYDEIGINLCQTIDVTDQVPTTSTAEYASVEALSLSFVAPAQGDPVTTITQIPNRPNCYTVTLTNLTFSLKLSLFDNCKRLIGTSVIDDVVYLPSDTTAEGSDEDTNPPSVTLELFAPYGISYTDGSLATPQINFIGFSSTSNTPAQGINIQALFKVLDFSVPNQTITLGLTLTVNSMYYNEYQIPHNGKTIISKGKIINTEDSVCLDFVTGSLLDRNIKPLELCNPMDTKSDCSPSDATPCMSSSIDTPLTD